MTLDSIGIAIPRNQNNNELYRQNIGVGKFRAHSLIRVSPITAEYIESGSRLTGSPLNIKPISTAFGTENPEHIWLDHTIYQLTYDCYWMNAYCGIDKLNFNEARSSKG
ncbi:hypothetical protein BHYA_0135g00270 [Botrytis hyacinthi]|uniref:Uncharacterized protein n=1 Tax=Botrytis hyacinthi TaxID=278943 RepID=A0A4Z1GNK8_9HELO|nr:hypothetical protein BHYA_0135g00270 [Botrytis hyacinthi]